MEGALRTAKAFLLPGAIGALILYFSYHALAGDQGLAAWSGLQKDETSLEAELDKLKVEHAALEQSLDPPPRYVAGPRLCRGNRPHPAVLCAP